MTLYRIHRPQQFKDVLGQQSATLTLQRSLSKNRIAHAYLFSGPRGTGKTSTARIFARALVCLYPVETTDQNGAIWYEPCNTCAACQAVLAGQATDLLEIDAASNRGIEDIRSLREQVNYHPVQLKKKIYIIDEVHMLTGEAFNALLKTLEEPPDYCFFILATTEPQKVPITIRSRCQLIRFEKGSLEFITQKLQSIVEAQGFTVEPAALSLIALQAEGGFRDSETLLETLCNQFDPLTLSQAQNSLGLLETELVDRLINSTLTGQSDDLTGLLREKVQPLSGSLERLIAQIINQVRLLLYQDKPETALIAYLLDQLLVAYLTQKGSPVPIVGLEIALFNTAEMSKNTNATTDDVIELSSHITVDSTPLALETIPQTVTKGLISAPVAFPSVPVVELSQDKIKDVRKAWKLTIERIARENMILAQALKETIFHTAVSNTITIHVRFKFHADKMREKKNHQLIQNTLEDMTGQKWEIEYIVANQTPKERILKKLPSNLQDAVGVFQDPE